jgi:hypothetical protein
LKIIGSEEWLHYWVSLLGFTTGLHYWVSSAMFPMNFIPHPTAFILS